MLPDVDPPNFPKEKYFETVKIDTYDCFIIITASRFRADDAWLADELSKKGKMFILLERRST